jgi:hypothetical protein
MGLGGYYKHFIKGFSKITGPFTALKKKNTFFKWSVTCKESFQELKQRLVKTPVLMIPTELGGFVIYNDALKVLGVCVLMQNGKVIANALQQLKELQTKLSRT